MNDFCCPVCGGPLKDNGRSLLCENRHCFDLAKSGYVNLLMSKQSKQKRHGDDKRMVRSRRDFLDKGYYGCLLTCLSELADAYAENGGTILDAGCGECYFTANILRSLQQHSVSCEMLGVDISKDALAAGAARSRALRLAVASVFHLPMRAASCELLLSVFAPFCAPEFHRVLKQGGILIRAVPLERHLWQLKQAVYDRPYENTAEEDLPEGFALLERREIRQNIHLSCRQDILNAFSMTPYYYKTGQADQEKLSGLTQMDTEIEFGVLVYRKI